MGITEIGYSGGTRARASSKRPTGSADPGIGVKHVASAKADVRPATIGDFRADDRPLSIHGHLPPPFDVTESP
ncbi:MAG: hypothetical protein ABS976_01975, partial [Rhodococcus sp. (in: high G+C Gram-positive bacteria)]